VIGIGGHGLIKILRSQRQYHGQNSIEVETQRRAARKRRERGANLALPNQRFDDGKLTVGVRFSTLKFNLVG
jgi:hypothetical protein